MSTPFPLQSADVIGGGRTKVAGRIIASLRGMIARGELAPGSQLPIEKELARQYSVSQPTMREAVRALEAMGLLEVHHGRGVFIANDLNSYVSNSLAAFIEFEQVGLVDTLDVRGVLGRHSAHQAALNAGGEELDALAIAADACDNAGELATVLEMATTVVNFQSAVAAAARNPLQYGVETFLIRLLLQLQVDAKESEGPEYWTGQIAAFRSDRQEITKHIRGRDPAKAEGAMAAYLEDQKKLFEGDPDMANVRFSHIARSGATLLD